ncbi:hypothetical protein GGX14DRAFT_405512 [Mycena pura]|uniref:Uncharacterized protein n=1 Tax=Mycena pura TaxID=153505 RepID=A0AAD6UW90_9AGAR|nr:hypothetical protein GGX14DRAFT_405512 [Mycena pura]
MECDIMLAELSSDEDDDEMLVEMMLMGNAFGFQFKSLRIAAESNWVSTHAGLTHGSLILSHSFMRCCPACTKMGKEVHFVVRNLEAARDAERGSDWRPGGQKVLHDCTRLQPQMAPGPGKPAAHPQNLRVGPYPTEPSALAEAVLQRGAISPLLKRGSGHQNELGRPSIPLHTGTSLPRAARAASDLLPRPLPRAADAVKFFPSPMSAIHKHLRHQDEDFLRKLKLYTVAVLRQPNYAHECRSNFAARVRGPRTGRNMAPSYYDDRIATFLSLDLKLVSIVLMSRHKIPVTEPDFLRLSQNHIWSFHLMSSGRIGARPRWAAFQAVDGPFMAPAWVYQSRTFETNDGVVSSAPPSQCSEIPSFVLKCGAPPF